MLVFLNAVNAFTREFVIAANYSTSRFPPAFRNAFEFLIVAFGNSSVMTLAALKSLKGTVKPV
jgi:hypothetical protein